MIKEFHWKDCKIENIRSSGPGGQHKNVRETGIRMTHKPTGIVVTATERRSRHQNLKKAKERLMAELDDYYREPKKRIPTKPPSSEDKKRLERKKRRSEKKKRRKDPPLPPD